MLKDLNDLDSGLRVIMMGTNGIVNIKTWFKDIPINLNDYNITTKDALKIANALKEIADV